MAFSPEVNCAVESTGASCLHDLTALALIRNYMIEESLSGLPLELRMRKDAQLSAIELAERTLERAGFGVGYWQTTTELAVGQAQRTLDGAATAFVTPPDPDPLRAIAEISTYTRVRMNGARARHMMQDGKNTDTAETIASLCSDVASGRVSAKQGIDALSRQLAALEAPQPVFRRAKKEAGVIRALTQTYGPDTATNALSVSSSRPFGVEARALRAELFGIFAHEHAIPQWTALTRPTKDRLVVLASLSGAPFREKTQLLTRHPELIFALSTLPPGVAEKFAPWAPAVQAAEALCVEAVLAQKTADDIARVESWATQAAETAQVIAGDIKRVARGVGNATREVVSDPAGTLLRAGDDAVGFITARDQPPERRLPMAAARISGLTLALLLPACATAPSATPQLTPGAPDGATVVGPSTVDVFAQIPQFVSFLEQHGVTPDCVVDQSFFTAHTDQITASLGLFKSVVELELPPEITKADCVVQTGDPNIPIVFQLEGGGKIFAVDPSGQLQEALWKDGQLIFAAETNQAFLAQGPEATPGASAYPASIDYNALRELVAGQGGALPEGFMENTEVQARIALRKAWLDQSGTPYVSVDVITWGSGDAFRWDVVGKDAQGNIVGWLQVKDSTMPGGWRYADGPSWDSSPSFNPQTDIYGFALPQKLNETNRFVVVSIVKPGEEGRILVEVDAAGNPVRWLSAKTQTWETPVGMPTPTKPPATPTTTAFATVAPTPTEARPISIPTPTIPTAEPQTTPQAEYGPGNLPPDLPRDPNTRTVLERQIGVRYWVSLDGNTVKRIDYSWQSSVVVPTNFDSNLVAVVGVITSVTGGITIRFGSDCTTDVRPERVKNEGGILCGTHTLSGVGSFKMYPFRQDGQEPLIDADASHASPGDYALVHFTWDQLAGLAQGWQVAAEDLNLLQ